jgi:hypothetical protein
MMAPIPVRNSAIISAAPRPETAATDVLATRMIAVSVQTPDLTAAFPAARVWARFDATWAPVSPPEISAALSLPGMSAVTAASSA